MDGAWSNKCVTMHRTTTKNEDTILAPTTPLVLPVLHARSREETLYHFKLEPNTIVSTVLGNVGL